MRPEMSLVFLTVLGGIGQGIFMLTFIVNFVSRGLSPTFVMLAVIAALIFQGIGGIASIFHLGHPSRGWKAMKMFKQSWLSREAITLGLASGFTALYLLLYYLQVDYKLQILAGVLAIIFGFGFYLSSAMLYAVIRYIKEWSNAFTPINFALTGVLGGSAIVFLLLNIFHSEEMNLILLFNSYLFVLTIIALVLKFTAFRFNKRSYTPTGLKNALGINDSNVRLMDMGTSYEHYNTMEYSYKTSEKKIKLSENIILLLAYLVPLTLWIMISYQVIPVNLWSVIISATIVVMIIGFLLERRLFFIHGNHIQNLYYGNFRSGLAINPILSKARKGTPTP